MPTVTQLIVSRESKTTRAGQLPVDREHAAVREPDEEQGSVPGDHRGQARRLRVHAPGRRQGARPHLAAGRTISPGTRVPAIFWDYPREFEDEHRLSARRHPRAQPQRLFAAELPALVRHLVDAGLRARLSPTSRSSARTASSTTTSARTSWTRSTRPIRKLDEMGYIDVNRHRSRRPQLRRVHDGQPAGAHAVLQGRHRRRRRLQPHADADDVPGRAPQLLGRADDVYGDVAVLLRRSDPGAAADVSRRAGQQLRHVPHPVRAHDAGADRAGQDGGALHLPVRIARAARQARTSSTCGRAGSSGSTSTSRTRRRRAGRRPPCSRSVTRASGRFAQLGFGSHP